MPIIAALLLLSLYGASWIFAAGIEVLHGSRFAMYGAYVALQALLSVIALHAWHRRSRYRILIGPFLVLLLAVTIVDLTFLRYFRTPLFLLYFHLPVDWAQINAASAYQYLHEYVPSDVLILAAGLWLAPYFATRRLGSHRTLQAMMSLAALIPVLVVLHMAAGGSDAKGSPGLIAERPLGRGVLTATDRLHSLQPSGSSAFEPSAIVLAIVESAGRNLRSSDGVTRLADRLIALGGGRDWINFENAVTNSNASDVSVPSLLTGSGPHESLEKLQTLPFVSDLARSRGYRPSFATSSTLDWANFRAFFAGARFADIFSAETSGQPFLNDLAVDDSLAFRAAGREIARDGRLFLVVYSIGLHSPFQEGGAMEVPSSISNRLSRATWIQEAGYASLFDELRAKGIFDDALIFIVGDHGEYGLQAGDTPRLETFGSGILSPIFLVKLPRNLPEGMRNAAFANSRRLVQNLDIAPSIAHMLDVGLAKGLVYAGKSLFEPLPEDRIAFSAATSQWRGWIRTALAASRGTDRMLCETADFCNMFSETGDGLVFRRKANEDDALYRSVLENELLRRTLGQIYRDHISSGSGFSSP